MKSEILSERIEIRIVIDPLLQIARDQLGAERFETLAAEGRAMTTEQAVAYALQDEILSDKA